MTEAVCCHRNRKGLLCLTLLCGVVLCGVIPVKEPEKDEVDWKYITDIPRACSTTVFKEYPFCNPELALADRVNDLIGRLDLSEKPPMLTARESPGGDVPRLGVPEYDWGANCIHGVQSRCGTKCPTAFPSPNGLGATFNMSIVKDMGAIIGIELRSLWLQGVGEANHGKPHIGLDCWSPNININRDPRWGRNMEVPSEDPYVNGRFGIAVTKGLQEGTLDPRFLQAVVTLKHWAAYSLENWGDVNRHNFDAKVSDYDLADTYFPAFKASVVEGHAKGVMCSYNALNGVPTCADAFLNSTLRGQWNFDGYVVSDSGAINDIWASHHYSLTPAAATARALKDGSCDINSGSVYKLGIYEALALGEIHETDVDRALFHSLKLRFELGLFDPIDDQPYWHVSPDVVHSAEHEATSLLSTLESMVLLKNEPVTPTQKVLPFVKGKKIAVVGPHGNSTDKLLGNYNGQICPGSTFDYSCIISPFMAIESENAKAGGTTVYEEGCTVTSSSTKGFDAAIAAAQGSDYVVIILGIDLSIESEGRDRQLGIGLPGVQEDLAGKIFALGKPTVVVLINGGMVSMEYLNAYAPAIIEAWYPGFNGGTALAMTIFGDYNPGGKLPITLYSDNFINEVDYLSMDMTVAPGRTYRYYNGSVVYEFGFGLSYTMFDLKWSHNSSSELVLTSMNNVVKYTCIVKNVGKVAGDVVVLAFFSPQDRRDSIVPLKQLFGFKRVHLDPSESTTIDFELNSETLSLVESNGDRVVVPGSYVIELTNGVDISLKSRIVIDMQYSVIEKFKQV